MIRDLKIAIAQSKVPMTVEEGEKRVERTIKEALLQPVDMVGLPEDCVARLKYVEEDGYDPFLFLSKIAKENNIYLFGANIVKDKDGKFRNAGFIFDKQGNMINRHDKVVLTPPEEKDGIIPGNTLETFDTEFGKMALLVCKDSFHRYAAWFFNKLARAGVDVILVPSYSLDVSRRSIGLWIDSLKALSKWFDVYIAAPGTVGDNSTEYRSFGHSLIVCPNREILAEGSYDKEEILRATLDVKSLEEIRNSYGAKWQPKDIPNII